MRSDDGSGELAEGLNEFVQLCQMRFGEA
jgi:hypothetical protein